MIHRSIRKRCSLGIFTVVSAFAATTALTSPASAMEGIIPFLPGVSVGVPVGALPPPGFYFSQAYTVFDLELRDNRGRATGIKISDLALAPQVLWVPDIKILGATYGAFVAQPLRRAGVDVGGTSLRNFEAINTVISPINLSWNLGGGFFASAGLVVYTGAWTYSLNNPNNAGRNYWTIEPNFGLSYLADGWNLTVHPVIDFNGRNNLNKYQSGTIFVMDYSATKKISKWELGLGGTLIKQLSDDTIRGVTVPAVTGFNGKGNRASSLSVGPVIGYDFGDISVKGYVLRDVYADNAPKGNRFWFRVDVPLTAPPTAAGPADAGGSRS